MERIVGTRRGAKMEKGRGAARSAKGPDEAGLRLLGVVETLVAPFSTLSFSLSLSFSVDLLSSSLSFRVPSRSFEGSRRWREEARREEENEGGPSKQA